MKLEEYLKQLENEPFKNELPAYIEAEGFDKGLIRYQGKTMAIPFCWGAVRGEGKYTFFRTDEERGYIEYWEDFPDEESLVEFVKNRFDIQLAVAAEGPISDSDMMRRFINEDCGYTKEEAAKIVDEFSKYEDIFDEFRTFQRYGDLEREDYTKTVIQGYTGIQLVQEYHMTEVEACLMMIRLRKDPSQAIKELEQRKTES